MDLRTFPRPENDNGIGLTFRLNLKPSLIEQGVKWLQQIHTKWTLIAGQDWNQILLAAKPVYAAGIMPVCRLICRIDHVNDFVVGVKALQQAGIPPYVQIYNEPGNGREWRGRPKIDRFGGAWATNAALVFDAGGYPGIQVLTQEEWLAAFKAVEANGRMDIWERAWFCTHNGGANHPPSYPYDDVNLHGTPVDAGTYAQYQWVADIDYVNNLRASSANPNPSIMTDDTAVLSFLEHRQWIVESLGFSLPIIGCESGWGYGADTDLRYPRIDAKLHASFHAEMFGWFSTGVLSNGDPLPDELFSISNWIMADWGAEDWWYGPLGTKQQTIDAVSAIPVFTRKFSWVDERPAAKVPAVIIAPPQPSADSPVLKAEALPGPSALSNASSPAPNTYVVQPGDTLASIAKRFGVRVPTLVVANHIVDPSRIRLGQTLLIPPVIT